jgi:hypothetical protein
LDLKRKIEKLRQELGSNNEVIKLLKEDINSLHWDVTVSTSQGEINVNWLKQNNNKSQKLN